MLLFIHELVNAGGLGPNPPVSLRAEGAAMLAAMVDDFQRAPGVTVATLLASGTSPLSWAAARWIDPSEEASAFRHLARQADFTLVIAPETGGLLEQRNRWVLDAGGRLLGCRPDAVRLTADKAALSGWWQQRKVPTPASLTHLTPNPSPPAMRLWTRFLARGAGERGAECEPELRIELGPFSYPVVCKPRFGAGAQATFFISGPEELASVLQQARRELPAEEFLLQPFIPGRAASAAFLIGPRQRVPLTPAWQIQSTDGRFHYLGGRLPIPQPWRDRALRLASQAVEGIPGLQGYVGVDLVLGDDGRDVAIEINPRLTTSYLGLRRLARGNLAETWLRLAKGETVNDLVWGQRPIRWQVGE